MSHFSVLVLAEGELDYDGAQSHCETVLEPYSENREVDEYETDCHCVGWTARSAARDQVWTEELKAERERRRNQFRQLQQDVLEASNGELGWQDLPFLEGSSAACLPDGNPRKAELVEREAKLDTDWVAFVESFQAAEKEAEKAHPLYHKPDPDCEECGGTGRERTTYNPQSQWDWWVIGGRWTGVIDPSYDPASDERNFAKCWLCTDHPGKRYWRVAETFVTEPQGPEFLAARLNDATGLYEMRVPCEPDDEGAEEVVCNGCDGTGISRNFHNAPIQTDVRPVAALPEGFDDNFYAMVTPDGEWHQRGRMGWFGMSSDDMSKDTWRAYIKSVVGQFNPAETTAIVVDCHI